MGSNPTEETGARTGKPEYTAAIRPAGPSDARRIAEVQVTAWQAAYRGLLPDDTLDRLSVDHAAERWQERFGQMESHVFVAEEGERVLGFVVCAASRDAGEENAGEIYVMYVQPEHWRQGHGIALLDRALAALCADGFGQVILWVLEGNQGAIAFYEASGFRADGGAKIQRRADGTEMSLVRYRCTLA